MNQKKEKIIELKFMDTKESKKLLEGCKDIITDLSKSRESFYNRQSCPQCRSTTLRKTTPENGPFIPEDPMPKYHLQCKDCGCIYDPFSGFILKTGNIAKALVPRIPILNPKE